MVIRSAPPVFEAQDGQVHRTPYGYLRHAWQYRAFFVFWVRRSLVTRYRQTSLGWLWGGLQPLLSSLILVLVFGLIVPIKSDPVPYPLFIITNIVLWSYFQRVVLIGTGSVIGNMELISRVRFPREFLPLSIWVESLVDLGLGLLVVAAGFVLYRYPLTPYVIAVLPAFLVQTMFTLGLTFLLATLAIFVRDLLQVAPLLMQLGLYLSPVIYPLQLVPGGWRTLFMFNPLGVIFGAYQEALFYGRFTLGAELAVMAVLAALLLAGSYALFKRLEWQFADNL